LYLVVCFSISVRMAALVASGYSRRPCLTVIWRAVGGCACSWGAALVSIVAPDTLKALLPSVTNTPWSRGLLRGGLRRSPAAGTAAGAACTSACAAGATGAAGCPARIAGASCEGAGTLGASGAAWAAGALGSAAGAAGPAGGAACSSPAGTVGDAGGVISSAFSPGASWWILRSPGETSW